MLCIHFLTSLCIALHGTIYSPWYTCIYYEHSRKVCRQANWAAARLEHSPACLTGSSCSNTTSSTEVSLTKSYYYEYGWVFRNRITQNALGYVSWDSNVFGQIVGFIEKEILWRQINQQLNCVSESPIMVACNLKLPKTHSVMH